MEAKGLERESDCKRAALGESNSRRGQGERGEGDAAQRPSRGQLDDISGREALAAPETSTGSGGHRVMLPRRPTVPASVWSQLSRDDEALLAVTEHLLDLAESGVRM